MSLILIELLFLNVFFLFFTVVRESISENSKSIQEETFQNVGTNSPHDPQAWADDEVDEEFVSLDAQEVLGTWQDLLAALQPPAQSVLTEQDFSQEIVEDDAVPKARAPDEAIEVEHNAEAFVTMWSPASTSVEDIPEVHKPSENTTESEFTEICEAEDPAACVLCEISGDIPAQQATTISVQEKSSGSEEAVGLFPNEASEEASAPGDLLALASE